jgi:hypothetical protein
MTPPGGDQVWQYVVTLDPAAGTAGLLRLVSVIHGRGFAVHSLRYESTETEVTAMVAVEVPFAGTTVLANVMRRIIHAHDIQGPMPISTGLTATRT